MKLTDSTCGSGGDRLLKVRCVVDVIVVAVG